MLHLHEDGIADTGDQIVFKTALKAHRQILAAIETFTQRLGRKMLGSQVHVQQIGHARREQDQVFLNAFGADPRHSAPGRRLLDDIIGLASHHRAAVAPGIEYQFGGRLAGVFGDNTVAMAAHFGKQALPVTVCRREQQSG